MDSFISFLQYSTSYLLQDDSLVIQYANELHKYTSDPVFGDFLFVFGTFLAAEPRNNGEKEEPTTEQKHHSRHLFKTTSIHQWKAQEIKYYNFAPVIKGGNGNNNNHHQYVVTKHHIAMDDFLNFKTRRRATTLPDPAVETYGTYTKLVSYANGGDKNIHKEQNRKERNLILYLPSAFLSLLSLLST